MKYLSAWVEYGEPHRPVRRVPRRVDLETPGQLHAITVDDFDKFRHGEPIHTLCNRPVLDSYGVEWSPARSSGRCDRCWNLVAEARADR